MRRREISDRSINRVSTQFTMSKNVLFVRPTEIRLAFDFKAVKNTVYICIEVYICINLKQLRGFLCLLLSNKLKVVSIEIFREIEHILGIL